MMVLESARRQLSKLAPLADQLNSSSDNFTRELRAVEAELQKLNLGLEVVCEQPLVTGDATEEVDDSGEHAPIVSRVNQYLGYGPIGPEWKLLVRRYRVYDRHDLDSIQLGEAALVKSSRELRMAAAGQIEELIASIEREARSKLESLRKVADPFVMPEGWEKILLGQDNRTGIVHVMVGQTGVAVCGLDVLHWRFSGLHNGMTIESGTPCAMCEALHGGNVEKFQLPPGWENRHQGIDEDEVVHVMKKDLNGDAVCGARPISTNINWKVKGKRICSKCRDRVRR